MKKSTKIIGMLAVGAAVVYLYKNSDEDRWHRNTEKIRNMINAGLKAGGYPTLEERAAAKSQMSTETTKSDEPDLDKSENDYCEVEESDEPVVLHKMAPPTPPTREIKDTILGPRMVENSVGSEVEGKSEEVSEKVPTSESIAKLEEEHEEIQTEEVAVETPDTPVVPETSEDVFDDTSESKEEPIENKVIEEKIPEQEAPVVAPEIPSEPIKAEDHWITESNAIKAEDFAVEKEEKVKEKVPEEVKEIEPEVEAEKSSIPVEETNIPSPMPSTPSYQDENIVPETPVIPAAEKQEEAEKVEVMKQTETLHQTEETKPSGYKSVKAFLSDIFKEKK